MQKLILKSGLSPGDIVMLTAAVRDLHACYPKRFLTDVRTTCAELWENNPHITRLSERDPEARVLDCSYPLIDRCNRTPYHCLHGFVDFLNEKLGLRIRPTAYKGDIHLSRQEKLWYSQVHELTRAATPFWIVAAGGKYDVTIKWWETKRYQEVVDHFRGRLVFAQVGEKGHHHPRIEGVIDLRGETSLRELVRLVYHAQGVLCPVTALMHLAAAVECKDHKERNRPCVVIAGGREPAHWEAYPDHQFIHTTGALPCCSNGGCWKDRVSPLGDMDARDRPENLCLNVAGSLPRCMEMIGPGEVIRRIELYHAGGVSNYLSRRQFQAALCGIKASAKNGYDGQPLSLQSARHSCERFIGKIAARPRDFRGRGIVICGGGKTYFTNAWVSINMLRRLGCRLPIQLWHLGKTEVDGRMRGLLVPLAVECVDAERIRIAHPVRRLGGWELKPYAILHSPFREVLLLDADNVPVADPEFLFETSAFKGTGAIFWPDYMRLKKSHVIWHNCGLEVPDEQEFETGQIVVDKEKCWAALCLTMWFNENSDFYYRHMHGDKDTFHLAFRKLRKSYSLIPTPIQGLEGTMCQHDFEGRRLFQHRNMDKWNLRLRNKRVEGFWLEAECREYVRELRRRWDGRIDISGNGGGAPGIGADRTKRSPRPRSGS